VVGAGRGWSGIGVCCVGGGEVEPSSCVSGVESCDGLPVHAVCHRGERWGGVLLAGGGGEGVAADWGGGPDRPGLGVGRETVVV